MSAIKFGTALVFGVAGGFLFSRQEPKPGDVTLTGGKALALEIAIKSFRGQKFLKTPYQKDLSHYTIYISETDDTYRVELDPGSKLISTWVGNDWLQPDGVFETLVIDKKTMKSKWWEAVG